MFSRIQNFLYFVFEKNFSFSKKVIVEGQIKSEWIHEIINFPKNDPKNLKDFCPMYCKNSQGRNPSKFSIHVLEIDDF